MHAYGSVAASMDVRLCHDFGVDPAGRRVLPNHLHMVGSSLQTQPTMDGFARLWFFDDDKGFHQILIPQLRAENEASGSPLFSIFNFYSAFEFTAPVDGFAGGGFLSLEDFAGCAKISSLLVLPKIKLPMSQRVFAVVAILQGGHSTSTASVPKSARIPSVPWFAWPDPPRRVSRHVCCRRSWRT